MPTNIPPDHPAFDSAMVDALKLDETILKTIFNAVPAAICLVDVKTRRFEWISPYIEKITGHRPEELIGHTPRAFYADDQEYERVGEAYKCFVKQDLVEMEAVFQHKDGRLVNIFFTAVKLENKVLVAIVDISERKRAEQEKLEMERQLFHTQKLESLGILASGIAHDFNNLLMSIMGNTELLARSIASSPGCEKYITAIKNTVNKAAGICNQMLAYSGNGKFMVEATNLSRAVEDMVDMLEVSISRRIVLEMELDKDLPLIEADAAQIGQVIMNFVINASEAIGEQKGKIVIKTFSRFCDEEYLSTGYNDKPVSPGRYVFLEVSDTGCGMDEETIQRIFEPFFTTKFTGRGLGMAAVLGIVKGHNGTIKIDSSPGKGTSIKALFPAISR